MKNGQKQNKWGRVAEDFVKYRLSQLNSGKIKRVHNKFYDLVHIFGNLNEYKEKKIEVKSCQLFSTINESKNISVGYFKVSEKNHKKLLKEGGLYIFVYMYQNHILFAILYEAQTINKLLTNSFFNSLTKDFNYNLRCNFFVNKEIKVI